MIEGEINDRPSQQQQDKRKFIGSGEDVPFSEELNLLMQQHDYTHNTSPYDSRHSQQVG